MALSSVPEKSLSPSGEKLPTPISKESHLVAEGLSEPSLDKKIDEVAQKAIPPLPVPQQDIQANREIVQKKSFDDISRIHAALCFLLTHDIESTKLNISENVRDALLNDNNSMTFILEKIKENPMKMIPWGFRNGFFDKIVNNPTDSKEKQIITTALHDFLQKWLETGTVRDVEFLDSITDMTLLKELFKTLEQAIASSPAPNQTRKKYNSLLEQTTSAAVLEAARDIADEMLATRLINKFQTFPDGKKTLTEEERPDILADFESLYESELDQIDRVIEAAKNAFIPSLRYLGTFSQGNYQEDLEAMCDIDELENIRSNKPSACVKWFRKLSNTPPTLDQLGEFLTMQAPEEITTTFLRKCSKSQNPVIQAILNKYDTIMQGQYSCDPTLQQGALYRACKKIITDEINRLSVEGIQDLLGMITDAALLNLALSAMRTANNGVFRKIAKKFGTETPLISEILLAVIRDTIDSNLDTKNFSVLDLREYIQAHHKPKDINFAWQQMQTSINPLVKQIVSSIQATRGIQITMQTLLASISNNLSAPLQQANFTAASLAAFVEAYPEPSNLALACDSMRMSQNPLIQEMLRAVDASGTLLSLPKVVEETMKKFEQEMEDLRTTIIAGKRGAICFADIEQLVKMEKRYHYEFRDEDIQQLCEKILEKGLDPLVTRFRGVKTHQQFTEAFKTAKTAQAHEIDAKLESSKLTLDPEDVVLLVGMGPDNYQAQQIIIRAPQQIQVRVKQIQEATQESFEQEEIITNDLFLPKEIPASQALQVALYIEQKKAEFEKISTSAQNAVFKRRKTRLPFTLQATKEGIFLIARKKWSIISDKGFYKIARAAAGITLNPALTLDPSARVFTNPEKTSQKTIRETIAKAKIALQYSGRKGFAKVYGYFVYTFNRLGRGPIFRVSIVNSGYKGNLADNLDKIQSDKDKVDASSDIITALATLHRDNKFHGDFKLENCLFRKVGSTVEIAVTDFGFTRTLQPIGATGTFETPNCSKYAQGSYGSALGPPWFNGRKNYTGDPQVVESFVVGQELWQLFYKEWAPEQANMMKAVRGYISAITDDMRQQWTTKIAEAIAQKRKAEGLENVEFEDITDPVKRMKYLIFELMDPNENPNGGKHMTVIEAQELLKKAATPTPAAPQK